MKKLNCPFVKDCNDAILDNNSTGEEYICSTVKNNQFVIDIIEESGQKCEKDNNIIRAASLAIKKMY